MFVEACLTAVEEMVVTHDFVSHLDFPRKEISHRRVRMAVRKFL